MKYFFEIMAAVKYEFPAPNPATEFLFGAVLNSEGAVIREC